MLNPIQNHHTISLPVILAVWIFCFSAALILLPGNLFLLLLLGFLRAAKKIRCACGLVTLHNHGLTLAGPCGSLDSSGHLSSHSPFSISQLHNFSSSHIFHFYSPFCLSSWPYLLFLCKYQSYQL